MEFPRSKSYLIDTNVLVYSVNRDSDYYLQARELLKYLSEKVDLVFISTQNIREAYRVMSHPKFPKPMTFSAVNRAVDVWLGNFNLVYEDKSVWEAFLVLKDEVRPIGNQVF